MAYKKIVWTETAANQRNNILKYWAKRNKSNTYSLKLLKLNNDKTQQIAQNPNIYRQSDFPETRIASMGHFSICYKIEENAIIITAFWDNRQDPKKLLQELKKIR